MSEVKVTYLNNGVISAGGWNKGIYSEKRVRYEQGLPVKCGIHGFHLDWIKGSNGRGLICRICNKTKQQHERASDALVFKKFIYWANNRKNHKCNLTDKYIAQLYLKQNGLCKLSGLPLDEDVMSLDRINSKKGYVKGNVQWVHIMVNRMKSNFEESEFIKMCNIISNHSNNNLYASTQSN